MTQLLDCVREDARHTLVRLTDLHASLNAATRKSEQDEFKIAIFREQQELVAFRREILDERRYRDERDERMTRDPFEVTKHPYASEFYPHGKL